MGEQKYTMLVIGLIESKKYARLVICFSEDKNTRGIKYGRLVMNFLRTEIQKDIYMLG